MRFPYPQIRVEHTDVSRLSPRLRRAGVTRRTHSLVDATDFGGVCAICSGLKRSVGRPCGCRWRFSSRFGPSTLLRPWDRVC